MAQPTAAQKVKMVEAAMKNVKRILSEDAPQDDRLYRARDEIKRAIGIIENSVAARD